MPDNVLNAMRGLTEYLMKENQLQDIKDKENKINTAAERVAQNFQSLPPSASIEDIQNAGFKSIEDAASLGTIQQVMPLINQMQSTTVQMYGVRKGEASSNAIRDYISSGTGQTFDPAIGGAEAIQLTQLPNTLNPPQQITNKEGQTVQRKYNLDGTVKSEEVVNAFGVSEQMEVFKQQEDIKFGHDVALANIRGQWSVASSSAGAMGNGGNLNPTGMKLRVGYEGQNGEILYTDAKGRGNYALQPDGSAIWYNGQIRKIDPETQQEKINLAKSTQDLVGPGKSGAYNSIYTMDGGDDLIMALTGQGSITVDAQDNPKTTNFDALYESLNTKDWEKKLGTKLNNYMEDHPEADKDALWNAVVRFKNISYNESRLVGKVIGSGDAPIKEKTGGLSPVDWNKGNNTIQKMFSAPEDDKGNKLVRFWLGQKLKMPAMATSYSNFTQLDSTSQAELVKLVNKYSE